MKLTFPTVTKNEGWTEIKFSTYPIPPSVETKLRTNLKLTQDEILLAFPGFTTYTAHHKQLLDRLFFQIYPSFPATPCQILLACTPLSFPDLIFIISIAIQLEFRALSTHLIKYTTRRFGSPWKELKIIISNPIHDMTTFAISH